MSEHLVQTLYAVLATTAISLGVVTLVTDHPDSLSKLQRKPFNCIYCMTWWVAIVVAALLFPSYWYLMAPVVQITAYITYQRLV
jgi:hypothetical protein